MKDIIFLFYLHSLAVRDVIIDAIFDIKSKGFFMKNKEHGSKYVFLYQYLGVF